MAGESGKKSLDFISTTISIYRSKVFNRISLGSRGWYILVDLKSNGTRWPAPAHGNLRATHKLIIKASVFSISCAVLLPAPNVKLIQLVCIVYVLFPFFFFSFTFFIFTCSKV